MKNWERNFPNKNPWTPEHLVKLRTMLGDGVPLNKIAREVGHSEKACQNKAQLQGYSTALSRRANKIGPRTALANTNLSKHGG